MVRRRDLDKTLKKLRELRFRDEPELFPRFVRFPELRSIEVFDSFQIQRLEIRPGVRLQRLFSSSRQIASVKAVVVALPPRSRVRIVPSFST